MTYDELVTNIRNYTEVNNNVFTAPVINTFITMAENQILREIDLDVFKLEVTGNMTQGNKFLTAPSDLLTHRYMILTPASGDQLFLDFRDTSFMKEYWANGSTQWGPYGSKNGASNPQIYFGNNENWSVSPSVASLLASNVFTEDVTQTAVTFTPGTDSRWSTTSKSYQNSRAPTAFQTIPTSVGHTYCLSFWVGHEYFGATVGSRLDGLARLQIGGYNSVFFKVPTKVHSAGERWYTFQFEAKA